MIHPVRLQLSRQKGFNLQALSMATNGLPVVYVARPGKWGNPLRVGQFANYTAENAVRDFRAWMMREPSVRSFENVYGHPPPVDALRGKNLACWCKLGTPCHADVLIELANRPICEAIAP
jgi:hypothetical protein